MLAASTMAREAIGPIMAAARDAPALVPAGMTGDRADVIFAAPEEISKMIEPRC